MARVVATPLGLGIATAGVAGGAALDAPMLGVLGIGVYGLLVLRDLASPSYWRRALSAPAAGPTLPSPRKIRDARLREAAEALHRARNELQRAIDASSPDVGAHVTGMLDGVDELVSRAGRLLATGESVARVLAHRDPKALRREIDRLRARMAAATDAPTAEHWRQAIAGREEHLAVVVDLSRTLERIQANLVRIVAALDALGAKVVRMGALDTQAMSDLTGDMSSDLSRLSSDVRAFEETLRHVVAAGARA